MKTLYLLMLILWEGAVSTWDAIWYRRDQSHLDEDDYAPQTESRKNERIRREMESFENHGHE